MQMRLTIILRKREGPRSEDTEATTADLSTMSLPTGRVGCFLPVVTVIAPTTPSSRRQCFRTRYDSLRCRGVSLDEAMGGCPAMAEVLRQRGSSSDDSYPVTEERP